MIEIITAVFVLAILMLILARLVAGGTEAMTAGRSIMDTNSSARAVLGFMERQLGSLVVDDRFPLHVYPIGSTQGGFCFWSMDHELRPIIAETGRPVDDDYMSVQGQMYYLKTEPSGIHSIRRDLPCVDSTVTSGGVVLSENVTSFAVTFYKPNGAPLSSGTHYIMPAYADIHLVCVSDESATQAEIIPAGAARDEFLQNQERGYFARVFFQNYHGYTSGYENN